MNSFRKDPDAVLDYKFDWSNWLAAGESLSTYALSQDSTILVIDESTFDSDSVTLWVSGGVDGNNYKITCHVLTDSSREDDRTIGFHIRER